MTSTRITVQNIPITISSKNADDYICITDMAKAKSSESRAADVIKNWVRSRTTLEFLGTWELLYNPDFKVVEFDHFRMQAGLPTFTLSVGEWIEKTKAIGLYVERGRYGGTYAHKGGQGWRNGNLLFLIRGAGGRLRRGARRGRDILVNQTQPQQ